MKNNQIIEAKLSENEVLLSRFFCEILELDKISIHDDFFTIGGTSIKALQLLNVIKQNSEFNFSVVDIFSCKTVHELAKKHDSLFNETTDEENWVI